MKHLELAPKLVAKVLEANDHPYRLTKPHHFRISSIGYCANKLVQDHLHPPPQTSNMRAALGAMLHRIQESMIQQCGVRVLGVEQEVELKVKTPKLVLTGHVDVLLQVGQHRVPVDFKNLSDFSHGDNLKKLSRDYRWQMLGYCRALKAPYGIVSLWGIFGSGSRTAIDDVIVENTDAEWTKVLKHLNHVVKCRLRKTHGRREYHKDQFPCTYCAHRVPCWGLTNTQLTREKIVLDDLQRVPEDVRAAVRALTKMRRDARMHQVHVTGCEQRSDSLARELLSKYKTMQLHVPGLFVIRRWGKAVRILEDGG